MPDMMNRREPLPQPRHLIHSPRVVGAIVLFALVLAAATIGSGSEASIGRPSGRAALAAPPSQGPCAEPNDGFAQACPIAIPTRVEATIASSNDLDAYVVRLSGPARLVIALTNLKLDYDIHLYNADGQLLQEAQQEGTADEILEVDLQNGGNYFIFINSGRGAFDPSAPYLLVVDLLALGGGPAIANIVPEPPPQATPPPTAAPSVPAARLAGVSGGRAVVTQSNGKALDGAPVGMELHQGDSVAAVGGGEVTIEFPGARATVNKNSAASISRLEIGGGSNAIGLRILQGRLQNDVSGDLRGTYSVVADRTETVVRGTSFAVTLRDDSTVLVDCYDCDPARVSAGGRPLSSGQRLAVLSSGEVQMLRVNDEPNIEPTPTEEEERREKN